LLETAEGVTVEQVLTNTEAELAIGPELARTNMARSTPEHVPVS
jgi:acyl CoA:acetate/3-ketoacid CoA transferase beta subunit